MLADTVSIQYLNQTDVNKTILLTGSKSECNRAIILAALSQGLINVENYSDAYDTKILLESIQRIEDCENQENLGLHEGLSETAIDIGPAGTAMRFLTALLCIQEGTYILTGSERMQQRPIEILVTALTDLGANISYLKTPGYPPLLIKGGFIQEKKSIVIQGNVSSQYLSALLLIGSQLEKGIELQISSEIASKPYLEMTLSLLNQVGIKHSWNENLIEILPQNFKPSKIVVEPDWSAASYWYAILAALPQGEIFLPNLKSDSLQGDRVIVEIMNDLGISSRFTTEGLIIKKIPATINSGYIDFNSCPDLAQTIIVLCAVLMVSFEFTGLETLKIKETDRIKALQTELEKIGADLIETSDGVYKLITDHIAFPDELTISTYEDHRMAMAFAVLATKVNKLRFEDKHVVNKSYPNFWKDLENFGFQVD